MSTRANIVIEDNRGDYLIFYRHSDGYPKGTLPTLNEFMDLIKEGKIRDNVSQASGWLILIGHKEYDGVYPPKEWKVGSYEPTTSIHGDIEFLYIVKLQEKLIEVIPMGTEKDFKKYNMVYPGMRGKYE